MRNHFESPLGFHYMGEIHDMLRGCVAHVPPEFDAMQVVVDAADPESVSKPYYIEFYLQGERVGCYGRGFGFNYAQLHGVPAMLPESLLVSTVNHRVLNKDDFVNTFRGEEVQVIDWRLGHRTDSSGRIVVADPNGHESEYFPGVINAVVVRTK